MVIKLVIKLVIAAQHLILLENKFPSRLGFA